MLAAALVPLALATVEADPSSGSSDPRYRAGIGIATTGALLVPAGLLLASYGGLDMIVSGSVAVGGGGGSGPERGYAIFKAGGVAIAAAPPIVAIGSLLAADVLKRSGEPVSQAAGWAGLGLWGGSMA